MLFRSLVYLNQIGGQDELVFDGASFVLNADRSLAVQIPAFEERVSICTFARSSDGWACVNGERATLPEGDEADYAACVLGLRDYVEKNGFPGVVMGLSGGIDSALVLAIAVDALGADKVRTLMMPSPYTADISWIDARDMANRLGVRYDEVSIVPEFEAFLGSLKADFEIGRAHV